MVQGAIMGARKLRQSFNFIELRRNEKQGELRKSKLFRIDSIASIESSRSSNNSERVNKILAPIEGQDLRGCPPRDRWKTRRNVTQGMKAISDAIGKYFEKYYPFECHSQGEKRREMATYRSTQLNIPFSLVCCNYRRSPIYHQTEQFGGRREISVGRHVVSDTRNAREQKILSVEIRPSGGPC